MDLFLEAWAQFHYLPVRLHCRGLHRNLGEGSLAKNQAEELTGAYDPQILAAIKTIGQGLMDLADALIAPSASAKPEPRPAAAGRPPKQEAPPVEEPDEDKEIELADLQKLAKDLIKAGGRPKLLKILEEFELENVSSTPSDLWPQLKRELEEASE